MKINRAAQEEAAAQREEEESYRERAADLFTDVASALSSVGGVVVVAELLAQKLQPGASPHTLEATLFLLTAVASHLAGSVFLLLLFSNSLFYKSIMNPRYCSIQPKLFSGLACPIAACLACIARPIEVCIAPYRGLHCALSRVALLCALSRVAFDCLQFHSDPSFSWLFCIINMYLRGTSCSEETSASAVILQFVLQHLPPAANIPHFLRRTALCLLGEFSDWLALHPEFIGSSFSIFNCPSFLFFACIFNRIPFFNHSDLTLFGLIWFWITTSL